MPVSSNTKVQYALKISPRARLMRLSIHPDGNVVVTVPKLFNPLRIDQFIEKHSEWIVKRVKRAAGRKIIWGEKAKISQYKKQARTLIEERVIYFSRFYGVRPGKISIRAQKSRWGSCSRQGNLSFNYQIVLLPQKLADQVIVHELCHLLEFNHSKKFWALVQKAIPDYLAVRKELRLTAVKFR